MTQQKLSYKEAYNRIVDAYFKDEIKPFDGCACFVGNLLNRDNSWEIMRGFPRGMTSGIDKRKDSRYIVLDYMVERAITCISSNSGNLYTVDDIIELERCFLTTYLKKGFILPTNNKLDEEGLFYAMDKTLDLLKQIHESHGEIVDRPKFVKRELKQEVI